MSSSLWRKTKYLAPVSYLTNTIIREYDLSKANINVLYSKGILDQETYLKLYNSERMVRQRYVGIMQKNAEVVKALQNGIKEARQMLFEANDIQDHEVLSIKNDAIFIIGRKLQYTQFGLLNFVEKNMYTSYYFINRLEMYYSNNQITGEQFIHFKGISDDNLWLHEDYMIQAFKDIFFTIENRGSYEALELLQFFYNQYITLELEPGYYRKFDSGSRFHYNMISVIGTGYEVSDISDEDKKYIDISYNLQFIIQLQKILLSMHFDRR